MNNMRMDSNSNFPTINGRPIGIFLLTIVQSLIGAIHIFFGLWLLSIQRITPFPGSTSIPADFVYSVYTVIFGSLNPFFAFGLWLRKTFAWIGTFGVLLFVTIADTLIVFNLPSIPGIPKFAAGFEIIYSILILVYLSQRHVRDRYKI